jgi:6-pyruvoyltetrahydropterin/6-carboxytetrahydropterin synthase
MYEITTQASFSAAHHLENYDGPCENVHGHNWLVKVSVRCATLDDAGIGIDFKILKKALNDILNGLDHTDLNTAFKKLGINPSSENIAAHIFQRLQIAVNDTKRHVHKVEVFETPGNSASYFEDLHA